MRLHKPTDHSAQENHLLIQTKNRSAVQTLYSRGFTLVELMVVVFIIAVASALAVMSLSTGSNQQNLQNAEQLAALLDAVRAEARAQQTPLIWSCDQTCFTVQGALPNSAQTKHYNWKGGLVEQSGANTSNASNANNSNNAVSAVSSFCDPAQGVIGPEPITKAQVINVYSQDNTNNNEKSPQDVNKAVQISTDGLGPFKLSQQ